MPDRTLWIDVDIAALKRNALRIGRFCKPGTVLFCVVKDNAYGHGLGPVVKALIEAGQKHFAVSTVAEALTVRGLTNSAHVLIMNNITDLKFDDALKNGIEVTVTDLSSLKNIDETARSLGLTARVHCKIDTGMGRLGLPTLEFNSLIDGLKASRNVIPAGLFSHLPDFGTDEAKLQIQSFSRFVDIFRKEFGSSPIIHLANSGVLLHHPDSHFDAVRPGLTLYGTEPGGSCLLGLEQVLSLKTRLMAIKELNRGQSVGYLRTFIAARPTKIGVLPVGYGHGYLRVYRNYGKVLIGERPVPIVGEISMDMLTIDLSGIEQVHPGDEVILIGKQGRSQILMTDIAKSSGFIPYEIMTTLKETIVRNYHGQTD